MANTYQIVYSDLEGNTMRCDIQEPGTITATSNIILCQGYVDLEFDDVDDPFAVIRTSALRIYLEADSDQTFEEIYSETERQWQALFYRNDVLIFRGWLSPDGIFEDYVNDAWVIELEARDGISDLTNKAFVDQFGVVYQGQDTLRSIIFKCLTRTGWDQEIRFQHRSATISNFPVEMVTTFPSAADFFDQKIDQSVFIETDGKTGMSCQKVLEQLLTACNGTLHSWGGHWWVNWALQHANPAVSGVFAYSRYNLSGSNLGTISEPLNYTIGSHITGNAIHWAGGNQRIERRPSVGAVRLSYRYKDYAFFNVNGELNNDGTTISSWTVNRPTEVTLDPTGSVVITNTQSNFVTMTSANSPSSVPLGNILEVGIKGRTTQNKASLSFAFGLVLVGTSTYYFNADGDWTTGTSEGPGGSSPTRHRFYVNGLPGEFSVNITTPQTPIEGVVYLQLFSPQDVFGLTATSVEFDSFGVKSKEPNPAEGQDHIAQRVLKPSSFTQPTAEVNIGDFAGGSFVGALYHSDGTTETESGYQRPTSSFPFPLYQCNVIDRLFLRSKPSKVFEGSVYGFIPYNARVTVDGFPGDVWVVSGYRWRSKEGQMDVRLFQVYWDTTMLDDTEYERVINYSQVIEPRIK